MSANGEQHTRAVVHERSGGVCEISLAGVCLGRAENISHRKAVGQGGEWSASNCMDACGSGTTGCHGWVEHNWVAANRLGLRLSRTQESSDVEVWMRTAEWPYGRYLLADDGTVSLCR